MKTFFYVFVLAASQFISISKAFCQEEIKIGVNGTYDTRIGDAYGLEWEIDQGVFMVNYGGLFGKYKDIGIFAAEDFENSVNSRYDINVNAPKSSGQSQWSVSYAKKIESNEILYFGGGITSFIFKAEYDFGSLDGKSFNSVYKFNEVSFDPFLGVRYPFSKNIVGDIKGGYGLPIINKQSGKFEDEDDFFYKGNEALGILKEFFVGIKISYLID
jgi:hypothetical protein